MDADSDLQEGFCRMDSRELVEALEHNKVRIQRLLAQVAGIRTQQASIRFEFSQRAGGGGGGEFP